VEESAIVLRAISDCNIPKFVSNDIPLFNGIIEDLFPTTKRQTPDFSKLKDGI
jgi:dynein heavy chain